MTELVFFFSTLDFRVKCAMSYFSIAINKIAYINSGKLILYILSRDVYCRGHLLCQFPKNFTRNVFACPFLHRQLHDLMRYSTGASGLVVYHIRNANFTLSLYSFYSAFYFSISGFSGPSSF